MNLLLHIGTHKTGTTSLQHFLTLNRDVLRAHGYFYPENKDSAYVFNFLASNLAHGKEAQTRDFMAKAQQEAREDDCHTVVISAESFYAMTAFFVDIQGLGRGDYWEHEARLVRAMREACGGYDKISIVCYVRPQDEFSFSLYNQFVKNSQGIYDDYKTAMEKIRNVFDYEQHIRIWGREFPQAKISVKNYTAHKDDLIEDFCTSFLNEALYRVADKKEFQSNTRLSRDVLEFKRIFNRTKPDRALAYVASRTLREISDSYPDKAGYQTFSSREERVAFFEPFEAGNKIIVSDLPAVTKQPEQTYTGLSDQTMIEIYLIFQNRMDHWLVKVELMARQIAGRIMIHSVWGRKALQPLRALIYKLRLRKAGW